MVRAHNIVIPGRGDAPSPGSMNTVPSKIRTNANVHLLLFVFLDSGLAAARRPGMTS
jgi:hypothetical protein